MKPYVANPTPKWIRCIPDGLFPSITILTLGLLIIIPTSMSATQLKQGDGFQCDSDGNVIPPYDDVQFGWNIRYLFSITLAWGSFSLSTAKLIDIGWDLCVGRGGQLLLSYLVFGTLRRSVLVSLRRSPWHLPVLTRQLLDPVSVPGLWAAVQDVFAQQGLHRPERPHRPEGQQEAGTWQRLKGSRSGRSQIKRLPPSKLLQAGPRRLCVFIPLITYILGFATIVSAMTGYRARMEPAYLQENGATIPLKNSIQIYPLRLQDWYDNPPPPCERVGGGYSPSSQAPYSVDLRPGGECAKAWLEYRKTLLACENLPGRGTLSTQIPPSPSPLKSGSMLNFSRPRATQSSGDFTNIIDQGACHSDGISPVASIDWVAYSDEHYFLTTSNITLGDRTWNIYMPPAIVEDWTDRDYAAIESPTRDPLTRYFSIGNAEATMVYEELRDKTLCQTTKVYQWGFSSFLLFLFGVATIISGAILLALNAVVWQQTRTRTLSVDFSIYRDILDLAGEIKAELGDDAEDLSATILNDHTKTDTGNVRVTEDNSLPSIAGAGGSYSLVPTAREALPEFTPAASPRPSDGTRARASGDLGVERSHVLPSI